MTSRKNMLKMLNDNSLKLYCLIKSNKIKKELVYQTLLSKNKQLFLDEDMKVSKKEMDSLKNNYTKLNCFDEILYLTDKKYKHLKDIRYVVDISLIVDTVVSDKIYLEKLNIHYTDLIIDLLVEDFYDYDSLILFSKLRKELIGIDSEVNHKIIENINKYYIRKITI